MKVNVLLGIENLYGALLRYLIFVSGFKSNDIKLLLMGKEKALSQNILTADLWIIEAWNPFDESNPEGFRTAYKLAGSIKCLLLFLELPKGFPEEGPFWCNPATSCLRDKITEVINNPPPAKKDFENLINLWPSLANEPKTHHNGK